MEIRSGNIAPLSLLTPGTRVEEETHGQPERTHGDRGIRHIKGRPVVCAYVEIEKIDHFSKSHPIQKVPTSLLQDQKEGWPSCPLISVCRTRKAEERPLQELRKEEG
jgi:hypothetical protein